MPICLVMGATSEIAQACFPYLRAQGYSLVQLGRTPLSVAEEAQEPAMPWFFMDAMGTREEHEALWQTLTEQYEDIAMVFCCMGYLGNQEEVKASLSLQERCWRCNFTGLLPLLALAAAHFQKQDYGTIVGVSSVAGERGRGSNYPYSSAKAGFTAYLSGLRQALRKTHVHVLTVKPGLVQTRMIEGRAVPAWLCATPKRVARDINKALLRKRAVIYSPGYWAIIMAVVRALPEVLYKHLPF